MLSTASRHLLVLFRSLLHALRTICKYVVSERINVGVTQGPRPRRPPRPRKPRATFWRSESIWTSEDDDILLADLLHLIPSDVQAQRVRNSVQKNPLNGYPHTIITYNHEILNTKFDEQMLDYESRIARYSDDLIRWQARDSEWCNKAQLCEAHVSLLQAQIEQAADDFDAVG